MTGMISWKIGKSCGEDCMIHCKNCGHMVIEIKKGHIQHQYVINGTIYGKQRCHCGCIKPEKGEEYDV